MQRANGSLIGLARSLIRGDLWAAHEYAETAARIVVADATPRRNSHRLRSVIFLQRQTTRLTEPRERTRRPAPVGAAQAEATM